ncbi:MAG: TIGR04283 family arsenosugar biosynthesis glycosyltransferase [Mariprofundales bacterium]
MVVPLLNEAAALPTLLMMVKHLPVDEVLLVDGGSHDGSHALLAASGLRWIQSPAGRACQMNAGAALCQSDTLLFLHADTVINARAITLLRTTLQNHQIQSGRFNIKFDSDAWPFLIIALMINWRSRISKISTGDQAQFVRRTLFNRLGGFPNQPLMEDIALSRQLKQVGGVACLKTTVTTSCRRWQQHGITRTVLLMWRLRWRYWLGASPESLAHDYRQVR